MPLLDDTGVAATLPSMHLRRLSFCAILPLLALSGCHSKYIEATITNRTGEPLNVVQVDYPSASFGVQQLKPGESFHYRFKLLGSGPLKLSYTDAARHEHQQTGPRVDEGQEGRLEVLFNTADHAEFTTSLRP